MYIVLLLAVVVRSAGRMDYWRKPESGSMTYELPSIWNCLILGVVLVPMKPTYGLTDILNTDGWQSMMVLLSTTVQKGGVCSFMLTMTAHAMKESFMRAVFMERVSMTVLN